MGWDEMRTGTGDGTKKEVVKYHFSRDEGMGLGGERYSRGKEMEGGDGWRRGGSVMPPLPVGVAGMAFVSWRCGGGYDGEGRGEVLHVRILGS